MPEGARVTLAAGRELGRYRLLEKVGEGGMGVVWSALDTTLGRDVALKLLPDAVADDPTRLARLESEARAIAILNHPGIVTLYSIEEAEGRRFLTMELVAGQSLADLIPTEGMPFHEMLRLSLALAEAVSAAHRRGIVHRDLKPRNVMVTAEGQVKVLDFGLAQSPPPLAGEDVSDRTTKTFAGGLTGTLAYMSPEQLQGIPADPRSDVISRGVHYKQN
jgi:serine/threonine protein kinase